MQVGMVVVLLTLLADDAELTSLSAPSECVSGKIK